MVTQVGVAKAKRRQHTEKTPGNERGTSADWNFDKLLEERSGDRPKLFTEGTMTPGARDYVCWLYQLISGCADDTIW